MEESISSNNQQISGKNINRSQYDPQNSIKHTSNEKKNQIDHKEDIKSSQNNLIDNINQKNYEDQYDLQNQNQIGSDENINNFNPGPSSFQTNNAQNEQSENSQNNLNQQNQIINYSKNQKTQNVLYDVLGQSQNLQKQQQNMQKTAFNDTLAKNAIEQNDNRLKNESQCYNNKDQQLIQSYGQNNSVYLNQNSHNQMGSNQKNNSNNPSQRNQQKDENIPNKEVLNFHKDDALVNQETKNSTKKQKINEITSHTSSELEIQSLSQVLPQKNQLKSSTNKKFIPKKIEIGLISNDSTTQLNQSKNDQQQQQLAQKNQNPSSIKNYKNIGQPLNLEEQKQRVTSIYSSQLTQKGKLNSNRSHHQKYIQVQKKHSNKLQQQQSQTHNYQTQNGKSLNQNEHDTHDIIQQNQYPSQKYQQKNDKVKSNEQDQLSDQKISKNNMQQSQEKKPVVNKVYLKMNQSKQSQISLLEAQSIVLKNGQSPLKVNSRRASQNNVLENQMKIQIIQKDKQNKMTKNQKSECANEHKKIEDDPNKQSTNQMEVTVISNINKNTSRAHNIEFDNNDEKQKYNHHIDIDLSKVEKYQIDEEIDDITRKNQNKKQFQVDPASPKSELDQRRTFYKEVNAKQQEPTELDSQLHKQIQNSSEIHRQNKRDLQKMLEIQNADDDDNSERQNNKIPLKNQTISKQLQTQQKKQKQDQNESKNYNNFSVLDSSFNSENYYKPKFNKKSQQNQRYLEDQNQSNQTQRSNKFKQLQDKLKRQRNNQSVHNISYQASRSHNQSVLENRLNYSVNQKQGVQDISTISQQRKNFCDVIMEQRSHYNKSKNYNRSKSSSKLKLQAKLKSPEQLSRLEKVNETVNNNYKKKNGNKSRYSNSYLQQQFALKNNPLYLQTPSYQNLFKEIAENASVKHLKQIVSPDLLREKNNKTSLKIIAKKQSFNQSIDYHNISHLKSFNQSRLATDQSQKQVKDFMKVILEQKQRYELNRSRSNDQSMNISQNRLKLNQSLNKSKESIQNKLPSKILDNSVLRDVNKVTSKNQNQNIQPNMSRKFDILKHPTSNINRKSKQLLQQGMIQPTQQMPRRRIQSEHTSSKQVLHNNLMKKNVLYSQKQQSVQNNENYHPYLLEPQQHKKPNHQKLQLDIPQHSLNNGKLHTLFNKQNNNSKQKFILLNSKANSGIQTPKYNKMLAPVNTSTNKPQSNKQYYRFDARSQSIQNYPSRPQNTQGSAFKADSVYNPQNIPSKKEYYQKIKKRVQNLSFQQYDLYNPQSDDNLTYSNQNKQFQSQQNYESDSNANRRKKQYKNSAQSSINNSNLVTIHASRQKQLQKKYQNQASQQQQQKKSLQDGKNQYTFEQYQNQSKSKSRFPIIDSVKNKRSISSNLNIILSSNQN